MEVLENGNNFVLYECMSIEPALWIGVTQKIHYRKCLLQKQYPQHSEHLEFFAEKVLYPLIGDISSK